MVGLKLLTANLCMSSREGCVSIAVIQAFTGIACSVLLLAFSIVRTAVLGDGIAPLLFLAYLLAGVCSFKNTHTALAVAAVSVVDRLVGPGFIVSALALVGYMFFVMAPVAQALASLVRRVRPEWFYEAVEERLQQFITEVLTNYDVICIQEVTAFYGFDSIAQDIRRAAAKHGLEHVVYCGRWPVWPSTFLTNGLMILSKHPIRKHEAHIFSRQAWFEWNIIQRGALMAQLEMPDGSTLAVLDTHTTCGESVLECGAGVGAGLSRENTLGMDQLLEVAGKFEGFCAGADHKVFCGDFNLNKVDISFSVLRQRLQAMGLEDCYPDSPATFGCDDEHAESTITTPVERRNPRVYDHVFSNKLGGSACIDKMLTPEAMWPKFTQVSDHRGVAVIWSE